MQCLLASQQKCLLMHRDMHPDHNNAYRVVVVVAPGALDLSAYDGQVLAAVYPLQVPVICPESIIPLGPLMPGQVR